MVSCEAAGVREHHVRDAGPPFRRKIGSDGWADVARMTMTGNAISRGVRVRPILGHDQRAAVGAGAPLLGRIGAGRELQLAGMRSGARTDTALDAARQLDVQRDRAPQCDDDESDDARSSEAPPPFACSTADGMLLS